MKTMTAVMTGLLLLVLPAACGKVEEMQQQMAQAGEQGEQMAATLKTSLGADAQVMANVLNGELMQVMVVLVPQSVAGKTVGEVEAAVKAAIQQHFGRQPKQVSIMLVSTQTQ